MRLCNQGFTASSLLLIITEPSKYENYLLTLHAHNIIVSRVTKYAKPYNIIIKERRVITGFFVIICKLYIVGRIKF